MMAMTRLSLTRPPEAITSLACLPTWVGVGIGVGVGAVAGVGVAWPFQHLHHTSAWSHTDQILATPHTYRGEAHEAVFIYEYSQRINGYDEHIYPEVELEAINEQRVRDVLLHNHGLSCVGNLRRGGWCVMHGG